MGAKFQPRAIALQYVNDSLLDSSSGGAFMAIATQVIKAGGLVFGASFDESFAVKHICVESLIDLPKLQGSKYVLSSIGSVFDDCLEAISSGVPAFFTGTPCQVYALRKFLEKRATPDQLSLLLCADIICHGTPAPRLLEAYFTWLKKKNRADKLTAYSFRSKHPYGWGHYYSYSFIRKGRTISRNGISSDDPYYRAFMQGRIYRKACYSCPFAQRERMGDFTMGDLWGAERYGDIFNLDYGVSALLINSQKADDFFAEFCSASCITISSTFDEIASRNSNLLRPTEKPSNYNGIMADISDALNHNDLVRVFESILPAQKGFKAWLRTHLPSRIAALLYRIRKAAASSPERSV